MPAAFISGTPPGVGVVGSGVPAGLEAGVDYVGIDAGAAVLASVQASMLVSSVLASVQALMLESTVLAPGCERRGVQWGRHWVSEKLGTSHPK